MASAEAQWSGSSSLTSASISANGQGEKKRRASELMLVREGRDKRRGRVLLLPALMEVARLLQYKNHYRNCSGRAVALRASLRVTCEAYLKLVGASEFKRDSGALRLIRLLTETHVQAEACALAKLQTRSDPRSMELRSMVQLAEIMAREYVAEMKGEEVLYTPPVPVEAFRPVNKRRRSVETDAVAAEPQGILHGNLRRVAERSAFTSVTPSSAGADSDSSDASISSVISSSEKCEQLDEVYSDAVVSETDSDEEEDEDDKCRADGKNLAQCMCYKCALGEDEDDA